jgi:hypothetical protein
MDVDTHGETGEVLERADSPGRLKGPAPKPILINLSRPTPTTSRFPPRSAPHPQIPERPVLSRCLLMLALTSSARRPLESPCEREYGRVQPGPCIQNRQYFFFPKPSNRETPIKSLNIEMRFVPRKNRTIPSHRPPRRSHHSSPLLLSSATLYGGGQ